MSIGISTASLYPMETEKALTFLGESGVKVTEIFFNSTSELEYGFIKDLIEIKRAYDINIVSIHPFTSFAESYCLFSSYARRFNDSVEFYKKYFEVAAMLGAKYVIIHGDVYNNKLSIEEYCRRFDVLINEGKKFDIIVTQENVNNHRSAAPEFITKMKDILADRIKFTFDVKQSVRAGHRPNQIIDAMGDSIVHIHISDHKTGDDCLLPGKGNYDFYELFKRMKRQGYCGSYILEVYNNAFVHKNELVNSLKILDEYN